MTPRRRPEGYLSRNRGYGRWNHEERSGADGERLRLGKAELGQREFVELEVAKSGTRPTNRIRICNHRRTT
jgi:hypothetical protein